MFFFYRKTLPEIKRHQRIILVFFRFIFLFCLLVLLINPILSYHKKYTEKPVFWIFTDHSVSMNQVFAGKPKTDYFTFFEKDLVRKLQKNNYSLEKIELFKRNPMQTLLLEEIKYIVPQRNLQGIILSSDGWFQDHPSAFRELINVPIYTYNPEITEQKPNINFENLIYNKNARRYDKQPIKVNFSVNQYQGEIIVNLKRDQKVVQTKTIIINENNNFQQVIFEEVFSELGLNIFEVELFIPPSFPTSTTAKIGEPVNISESRFAAIQVLEKKTKLLLLADNVTWDIRTINRIFNFNERFDVDLLLQEQGVWKKNNQLFNPHWQDYGGVIIIQVNNLFFTPDELKALKNMLNSGIGLLYLGSINNQLTDVLPSRSTNIKLIGESQTLLCPEALSYQIFREIEPYWSTFSPIQHYYYTPKEQTTVLVETSDLNRIPVIMLGHYGIGNVIHFTLQGLWKWQLYSEDSALEQFINGLGQWIFSNPTENFYAYTDKNLFYSGEIITVKLSAFDEKLNPLININAKLQLYDREKNCVFTDFLTRNNEQFELQLPNLNAGKYHYTIFDDMNNLSTENEFEVVNEDLLSQQKGFNLRLLAELSAASGGKMITHKELANFNFPQGKIEQTRKLIKIPLDKNVFFITFMLMSFCFELYFRKRWKLL